MTTSSRSLTCNGCAVFILQASASVAETVTEKGTEVTEIPRKLSHDQTIKIEKYHNLILRDIISESDFEKKMPQSLDLDDSKSTQVYSGK